LHMNKEKKYILNTTLFKHQGQKERKDVISDSSSSVEAEPLPQLIYSS